MRGVVAVVQDTMEAEEDRITEILVRAAVEADLHSQRISQGLVEQIQWMDIQILELDPPIIWRALL